MKNTAYDVTSFILSPAYVTQRHDTTQVEDNRSNYWAACSQNFNVTKVQCELFSDIQW